MILADKLIDLRKKNGWSQEDLADKLEVSRQSVSKWESAQSVPDMNRILKLSEIFGVSTDYLLKDELGPEALGGDAAPVTDTDLPVRQVSMEEATDFLNYRSFAAKRIALGVMLCVLSPILLIVLGGAMDAGKVALTEAQVGGIGLVTLILLVGCAVALFVTTGLKGQRYRPVNLPYGWFICYVRPEHPGFLPGIAGFVLRSCMKHLLSGFSKACGINGSIRKMLGKIIWMSANVHVHDNIPPHFANFSVLY